MKQFAVELKRTSYVTIYVDAETKEKAEDAAWAELCEDGSYGHNQLCIFCITDCKKLSIWPGLKPAFHSVM